MTDSDPLEPEPGPRSNEGVVHQFTTPVIHLTNDTQIATWGVNYAAGHDSSFTYRVFRATPLPELEKGADPAEYAVVEVAAAWGCPDFVFPPIKVPKRGGGTNEPAGDGIILCGRRGLMIQSKNREGPPKVELGDVAWLKREINTAYRQACGCLRKMPTNPVTLPNLRGRSFRIDGKGIDWTIVIVIEHPNIPECYLPDLPVDHGKPPVVVLTRTDWDFLHRQLRSNYAVMEYLQRARTEQKPLGEEWFRYGEYVLRDLSSGLPPFADMMDFDYFQPFPADELDPNDVGTHLLLQRLMGHLAGDALGSDDQERQRLAVLAALDAIPVVVRTDLGRQLLVQLANARECAVPTLDESIVVCGVADRRPYSVSVWVASEWSEDCVPALAAGTARCHSELKSVTRRGDAIAIGVILIPEHESSGNYRILLSAQGALLVGVGMNESDS